LLTVTTVECAHAHHLMAIIPGKPWSVGYASTFSLQWSLSSAFSQNRPKLPVSPMAQSY